MAQTDRQMKGPPQRADDGRTRLGRDTPPPRAQPHPNHPAQAPKDDTHESRHAHERRDHTARTLQGRHSTSSVKHAHAYTVPSHASDTGTRRDPPSDARTITHRHQRNGRQLTDYACTRGPPVPLTRRNTPPHTPQQLSAAHSTPLTGPHTRARAHARAERARPPASQPNTPAPRTALPRTRPQQRRVADARSTPIAPSRRQERVRARRPASAVHPIEPPRHTGHTPTPTLTSTPHHHHNHTLTKIS